MEHSEFINCTACGSLVPYDHINIGDGQCLLCQQEEIDQWWEENRAVFDQVVEIEVDEKIIDDVLTRQRILGAGINRIVPMYWPTEALFTTADVVDHIEGTTVFYKHIPVQDRLIDWRESSIDWAALEDVEF